ncbi:hypothetical protein PENSPDRAFT_748908 [Peniophora sp. CONT]|nr:hypothetical protein PENSPDRAFT_748908 [Peniophora sp. CONT]
MSAIMSSEHPTSSTQLDPGAFWQDIIEARLRTLSYSLSAVALVEEIQISQRALDVLKTELEARIKLVNGRCLPPEILSCIFAELAQIEPLGEIDADSDPSVSTNSDYMMGSDWSYDPELARDPHGVMLGELLDSTHSSTEVHDTSAEAGSQAYEIHSLVLPKPSTLWYPYSLCWTRVSHVCILWRDLAVSLAHLWCTVPFSLNAAWIEMILSRGRGCLLDVAIDEDTIMDNSREYLLENCFTRARSLDVCHSSPSIMSLVLNSLRRSTDTLQDLSLTALKDPYYGGTMVQAHGLELASYRALTNVTIENIDRFPKSGTPSMKQFSLTSCGMRPTSEDVMSFLYTLRDIETLELRECLPLDVPEFQPLLHNHITLPRLKKLVLENSSYNLWGNLIHHVLYPTSARVSVAYLRQRAGDLEMDFREEVQSHAEDHRPFAHFALERIFSPDQDLPPIQTLSISSLGGDNKTFVNLAVQGWRHISMSEDGRPDYYVEGTLNTVQPDASCRIQDGDNFRTRQVHRRILRALVGAVRLECIRVLSLDLDRILKFTSRDATKRWTADSWIPLLSDARRVEHVQVTSSAENSAAVDVLLALSRTSDETPSEFILFPILKTIEICDTIPVIKDSAWDIQAVDALRELLSLRRARPANVDLRVYIVRRCWPIPNENSRDKELKGLGLPMWWDDVDWVMDDEDIVLEDMRL